MALKAASRLTTPEMRSSQLKARSLQREISRALRNTQSRLLRPFVQLPALNSGCRSRSDC